MTTMFVTNDFAVTSNMLYIKKFDMDLSKA